MDKLKSKFFSNPDDDVWNKKKKLGNDLKEVTGTVLIFSGETIANPINEPPHKNSSA